MASHCEKCRWKGGAGCPFWIDRQAGFMETNVATGEERFVEGCFFQVMPRLMVHVVQASNRPAAAIESTRNEIAKGFARMAQLGMARIAQVERAEEVKALTDGKPDE